MHSPSVNVTAFHSAELQYKPQVAPVGVERIQMYLSMQLQQGLPNNPSRQAYLDMDSQPLYIDYITCYSR